MEPEKRDNAYLADMLTAARDAQTLASGLSYETMMADLRTRLALERALELIGEAARRVSQATRDAIPDIPWKGIIGTRNALAHEYGALDHRRLFVAVRDGVPRLILTLEQVFAAGSGR